MSALLFAADNGHIRSAGYPIISHFTSTPLSTLGGFNIGGINASGQIPSMPGNYGLIDKDTPQDAYTKVIRLDFIPHDDTNSINSRAGSTARSLNLFSPTSSTRMVGASILATTPIGKLVICTTGRQMIWNGMIRRRLPRLMGSVDRFEVSSFLKAVYSGLFNLASANHHV